jgi:hypothetical protein
VNALVAYGFHKGCEIFLGATGNELVFGIVVVDTVAEENPLRIEFESVPLFTGPFSGIGLEYIFQDMTQGKIPLAILVPCDVPSPLGGFRQMVCVLLLLEGKVVPSGNLIPYDIKVGELVDQILERSGLFNLFSAARG